MTSLSSGVVELATGIRETSTTESTSSKKPHLVFATPVNGHTNSLIRIAGDFAHCGFEIIFIGGDQFERAIAGIEREAIPAGVPRLLYDIRHIFTRQTPDLWRILKGVLEDIRAKDPHREVVVMPEACFMDANPISLGAPLPKGLPPDPR
ncbi:uncharacterized protein FTOL_10514 [Fusarium torulosum]|uniref:Uncharacterized protein n=1 Tax=Fusarium torulosum TaxID=33205 RepID=A0AAE8MI40_9HYPO|nr:uncharacterized protein FTOL_10514 [Fusarium torulosum]